MNYLLFNCHPYEKSFNCSVLKAANELIIKKGEVAESIDLIADRFDPVMHAEDLRLWGQGKFCDNLVGDYQSKIKNADILVFSFPVWWGAMPAVLKGFCEKVLLPNWAYQYGENGEMIGLLNDKKAIVITTMETPSDVFSNYFNNPVEGAFIKDTLQVCGIEVIKRFEIDKIVSGGNEYTKQKMDEIISYFNN